MRLMDEQYLKTPFYGVERMHHYIRSCGYETNIKRTRRLLRLMGVEAIYPKPKTTRPVEGHKIYPYLLKDLKIEHANQVWCVDITYIPMRVGFLYLVAVMDWFSRYVLAWTISNSLETHFCLEALDEALKLGKPVIMNTDQGSQFTSELFTKQLLDYQIKISMDSRGRALDNIFIERLWRSVKYEYVYLNAPETGCDLWHGLDHYFHFYNYQRPHQSLGYHTPAEVYNRD
jgi:putative transposase